MSALDKNIICPFCGANTCLEDGINQCGCPENNKDDEEEDNLTYFRYVVNQFDMKIFKRKDE